MKKFITFTLVLMMTFGVLMGIVYAKDDDTIVILYENDVHCAIEGYSKLAAMKKELLETYSNVGVVSSGDFVQGGTMGAVSKGEYIVNLMNKVGYDAITLGNHEFDYKLSRLAELNSLSNTKFISCNFAKRRFFIFLPFERPHSNPKRSKNISFCSVPVKSSICESFLSNIIFLSINS